MNFEFEISGADCLQQLKKKNNRKLPAVWTSFLIAVSYYLYYLDNIELIK